MPQSNPTNTERSERGRQIMEAYRKICSDYDNQNEDVQTSFAIGDVIADLLHLASTFTESDGQDPVERVLRLGQAHYEEESKEEEEDADDETE